MLVQAVLELRESRYTRRRSRRPQAMMLRMTDSQLAKKLLIKPGNQVLVLNAPDGYVDRLVRCPRAPP
jgi:hypothetical protein